MSELRQRRGSEEGPKLCPECGEKIEGAPKFCPECGNKMGGVSGDKNAPTGLEAAPKKRGEDMGAEETAALREDIMKEIQGKLLETVTRQPPPGLTKETKSAKEALERDPFSLPLMHELGRAYAVDEHWSRCVNVMLRGWKRVGELDDPALRFQFLMILCQASCRCKQWKQALAVLNDVDEPEDRKDLQGYLAMRCQVYCRNGDAQRALKAFHGAVQEADVETILALWASCLCHLKKVGAFEAAKNAVDQKMITDEDRTKLDALEKLSVMREHLEEAVESQPIAEARKHVLLGVLVLLALLTTWYFYRLEAASLSRMFK